MESTRSFFISPGDNITSSHIDNTYFAEMSPKIIENRWASEEGKDKVKQIIDSKFDRIFIDSVIGKFHGQLDLRGFDFSNQNLSRCNLSKCDLFRANFTNADCSFSDFSDAWLSEANLKSANFEWCRMENVLLDNIKYNEKTNFNGIDLNKINFTLATLFRDVVLSQQRVIDLEKQQPALAVVLKITTDYGRSLTRWSIWCCSIILLFAIIYSQFILTTAGDAFGNNLYFSIVTFTTVGYGDITPIDGIGKTIAMFEIGMGYLMGGLLIAILTKKVLV